MTADALTAPAAWLLIHAERQRLATVLAELEPEQWAAPSLCAEWTVEDVAAHLIAAANTGRWAWIGSMLRAGFNADRHNARMLARYHGASHTATFERFTSSIDKTIGPTNDFGAWLGEIIVHGQDIARPLDLELVPDVVALRAVADFFASKDFAVNSRTLVRGLRLQATDDQFERGNGDEPLVRGPLLSLVMAMAGRPAVFDDITGDGVIELRRRMTS